MDKTEIVLDCYNNSEINNNSISKGAGLYEKIGLAIGLPALLINILVFAISNFYISKVELFFNFMHTGKLELYIIIALIITMYINPLIEIFLGFIGLSAMLKVENKKNEIGFKLSIINIIIGLLSYAMTITTIILSFKFVQTMMILLF